MHLDLQMILKNFKTKKMMKYIKFYLKDVIDTPLIHVKP
jgi:hypothetical protein